MVAHKQTGALLLVVLASQVSCMDDDMAELAKMVRDNCAAETGVDISHVDKVNAGTDLISLQDKILKCYIKCTMETAGMFSDGMVDIEAVIALLPDDMRNKNEAFLRACGTKKGVDDCDTAFLTQVCWQQANKADYFLI